MEGEVSLKREPADGAMRIGEVVIPGMELADRGGGLFVRDADCGECIFYGGEVFVKELEDADEITGIADVHGIGEGRPGRGRLVVAGLEVSGDHIISVASGDEMFDGEAGAVREEACADVAEISARNADHRRVVLVGPLLPGEEIIELLGQPASDVDGIGGGEEKPLR